MNMLIRGLAAKAGPMNVRRRPRLSVLLGGLLVVLQVNVRGPASRSGCSKGRARDGDACLATTTIRPQGENKHPSSGREQARRGRSSRTRRATSEGSQPFGHVAKASSVSRRTFVAGSAVLATGAIWKRVFTLQGAAAEATSLWLVAKNRVMSPRRDTGRGPEEHCWFSST